jgi:hypothetical protein
MAFTYYPHDPNINRRYDPVEASYYLYQEYFINQNHWNTHAGKSDHGHDFSGTNNKSTAGDMRMAIDLMFLIELYRQLRARGDSRQTDLLNKLVVWLDYFYTGLNNVKYNDNSWYTKPFNGPNTAFVVNCFSQAYNHLPVESWRTARYKEIADAGAQAIANYEITYFYNGTGDNNGPNWYTLGLQHYDCGKYCGDGSTYSKAPYRRHNAIAMNAGALGRHAYHVARISGYPNPTDYPYRSSLVRLAQYIKNCQLTTNGGWKQGGLSGANEGAYYRCSTATGQQELAVGARCLAPVHYNMFDIIGLLWAGQGTTYTPQNQIPASIFADAAKFGGDFYTRLVTKTNMFPVYTDGNNNGTHNIVDVNALYKAGVVDYYDFHTSDSEVPSWYTGVAFLGTNYQWLVDQCFKREGFMEMAAHDHNASDTPTDRTITIDDWYGDGTGVDGTLDIHDVSKRATAKWGYQNEPCFHRLLLGLTGCMEKGLTIYG